MVVLSVRVDYSCDVFVPLVFQYAFDRIEGKFSEHGESGFVVP